MQHLGVQLAFPCIVGIFLKQVWKMIAWSDPVSVNEVVSLGRDGSEYRVAVQIQADTRFDQLTMIVAGDEERQDIFLKRSRQFLMLCQCPQPAVDDASGRYS